MPSLPPCILAIDVGTSSLKAVVYDGGGAVLASATRRYAVLSPQQGWAEADPQAWWDALVQAVLELKEKLVDFAAIQVIALTGQMHTVVLLDEHADPIRPAILWLDRRAAAETTELQQAFKLPPYQLNSTYSLPKLVWLQRNQPEVMGRARHLLWPKDYLRYRLTGELLTDRTEAGGAALLDWDRLEWAVERLEWAGISPSILPPLRRPTDLAGGLRPELVHAWGLQQDVRVLVGAGDVLALVTAAPPARGRLTCSMGSSSMVFYPILDGREYRDPLNRIYIYPLLPYPLFGGVSSTSGAAVQWAFNALFGEGQAFEEVVAAALETPAGAQGLLFLPFLSGERSPYWSDALRGAFYGLALAHNRYHLLRAVMEGVAYSLRCLLDIFQEAGISIEEIALAGGSVHTRGLPVILANVCQRRIAIFSGEETVTRGLYAYACQVLERDVTFEQALLRTFEPPEQLEPDREVAGVYDHLYRQYSQLAGFADQVLSKP
jgi:xylulokinase